MNDCQLNESKLNIKNLTKNFATQKFRTMCKYYALIGVF